MEKFNYTSDSGSHYDIEIEEDREGWWFLFESDHAKQFKSFEEKLGFQIIILTSELIFFKATIRGENCILKCPCCTDSFLHLKGITSECSDTAIEEVKQQIEAEEEKLRKSQVKS